MEDPNEQTKELINHHAHSSGETWISQVALTTALIAVLAAISGMLAGQYSNEAILKQIQASNNWAYYQSKGVKSTVLSSKLELLVSFGKEINKKDEAKLESYKTEQEEIKKTADEETLESTTFLHKHETMEKAVTLFQIAIAIAAISVLTRKKAFFAMSGLFGISGIYFMISGLLVH